MPKSPPKNTPIPVRFLSLPMLQTIQKPPRILRPIRLNLNPMTLSRPLHPLPDIRASTRKSLLCKAMALVLLKHSLVDDAVGVGELAQAWKLACFFYPCITVAICPGALSLAFAIVIFDHACPATGARFGKESYLPLLLLNTIFEGDFTDLQNHSIFGCGPLSPPMSLTIFVHPFVYKPSRLGENPVAVEIPPIEFPFIAHTIIKSILALSF